MFTPLRGVGGELRVGWHVAATLGAWSIGVADERFSDGVWTCTAEIETRDDFWLAHDGRFELFLRVGRGHWRWRGVSITVGDRQITARGVGAPEDD